MLPKKRELGSNGLTSTPIPIGVAIKAPSGSVSCCIHLPGKAFTSALILLCSALAPQERTIQRMVQHDEEDAASAPPARGCRPARATRLFYVSTADFKGSTKRGRIPGLYENNVTKGKKARIPNLNESVE